MTAVALTEQSPDSDLWQLVRQGSASAFEVVVRRHQSLVCAVAYSVCGNLALSEDVAQETFWTAWRERASLEQPERLGAWLCGIARNLGKNARRRASRPAESAGALDVIADLPADEPEPVEEAVSREEESLVWGALERIPETYREPLILFYREDQSIAEVAEALGLSEDAVKQRLSRGRGMLREQVAELVETGLRRSRPGRRFTVAVMAGLAVQAAGVKSAMAGVGAAASAEAAAGAALGGGLMGGLLGTLGGLFGGWIGTWVPAQLAPTRRERDSIMHAGVRILLVSVLFILALLGMVYAFAGRPGYLIAWFAWFVAFQTYILVETLRLSRLVKRIRAEASPDDLPNVTPLRTGVAKFSARYRGRVFRSRAELFGIPLIDINVGDLMPQDGKGPDDLISFYPERPVARGWIAIGDDARGILLAIGGIARGFIAMGGRSLGVLSFGGVAVGIIAFGGLALGVVGIGGLGIGIYALGGGAIGWQASGGGAIAWDVACGGGAVAWHAALGGGAIAHDYAIGGAAWALHANDEAAKAVLLGHPLVRGMEWYIANMRWVTAIIVAIGVLPSFVMMPLMYRRA